MNTPVNFELAKLLKEKGFDEWTKTWHQRGDGVVGCVEGKRDFYNRKGDVYTSAPTISEVVMWLYEKHGIWIEVNRVILGSDEWGYGYVISYLPKEFENAKRRCPHLETIESFKEGIGSYIGAWNSPIEAYEAAIEYVLNNLV